MNFKVRSGLFCAIMLIVVLIVTIAVAQNKGTDIKNINGQNPMKITSDAFQNNGKIPAEYTCDGNGIRPPLEISDIPEEAKTLALIVDDPDAPSGDFVHWIIWNINSDASIIESDKIPDGSVEGYTSLGKPGWIAPCPPSGIHRYNFKIYALDTALSIPKSSNKANLTDAMKGHIVDSATLIGLYGR